MSWQQDVKRLMKAIERVLLEVGRSVEDQAEWGSRVERPPQGKRPPAWKAILSIMGDEPIALRELNAKMRRRGYPTGTTGSALWSLRTGAHGAPLLVVRMGKGIYCRLDGVGGKKRR